MKKVYMKPALEDFMLEQRSQLLAGSGPGAGDQGNPGMGGGSGSRSYGGIGVDDEEDF